MRLAEILQLTVSCLPGAPPMDTGTVDLGKTQGHQDVLSPFTMMGPLEGEDRLGISGILSHLWEKTCIFYRMLQIHCLKDS